MILIAILLMSVSAFGQTPEFDAARAFADLGKQCSFGPRNPGSRGHEECRLYLAKELDQLGLEVWQQSFEADDPVTGAKVQFTNIIAKSRQISAVSHQPSAVSHQPDKPLLLCAHWDTRPRADNDPDSAKRNQPIIGANDGASGVAVLLELARVMAATPPPRTVVIALWDGEDMGRSTHPEEFCLGAKYWAAHQIPEPVSEAILLDMVGDADLSIPIEGFSAQNAPGLAGKLWDLAHRLELEAFNDESGPGVEDDHLALQKVGIPAVDIIDFDYRWWHTTADTPDKCSPESLAQVGRLLAEYIYGEK